MLLPLVRLPSSLGLRLALLALTAVAPLFGVLILEAGGERRQALDAARGRALELAQIGAQQQDDALRQAEHLLRVLARVPEVVATARGADDSPLCHRVVADVKRDYAQATSIVVARPDGSLACRSDEGGQKLNLSDHPWFQQAVSLGTPDLVLGGVFVGRISGRRIVSVALPLGPFDAARRPVGVLVVSLDLAWFQSLAAQVSGHPGEAADVIDLASGQSITPADAASKRTPLRLGPAASAQMRERGAGTIEAPDASGAMWIVGFAELPGAGRSAFAMVVEIPMAAVFADADRKLKLGALIALAAVAAAIFGAAAVAEFSILRPIRTLAGMAAAMAAGDLGRRAELSPRCVRELRDLGDTMESMADAISRRDREMAQAQVELARSEEHYRLLADNTTDVITLLRPDFRRVYVSPSCWDVLGYGPDDLVGRDPRGLAHTEDCHRLTAALEDLQRGQLTAEATYRMRMADGEWLWVEATGKRLPGGAGFVTRTRNIHARKTMEATLEEANSRLRGLALLDGLTGLANRRQFEEALELEYRRAHRDSTPLGLVMIDLDEFKLFNDLYGHLGGDECLRAVAATVAGTVQRPADLVARYGGEELAMLLPGTDRPGTAMMAERVRAAVAALGLEHAGTLAGIVTVSVGAASAVPGEGLPRASDLVETADQALYAAKRAGRNTVCFGWPDLDTWPASDVFVPST